LGIYRTWSSHALDIKGLPQLANWQPPCLYAPILIISVNGVRGRRNGVNLSERFPHIWCKIGACRNSRYGEANNANVA